MELKELTDRTLELFGVDNPDNLGSALLDNISKTDKLKAFCDLVDGDLSVDWMQKIYQYYLADRKEKKQDYTPKSVAQLMGAEYDLKTAVEAIRECQDEWQRLTKEIKGE